MQDTVILRDFSLPFLLSPGYSALAALFALRASRDLRLAAWFLWITPFFAARSTVLKARLSSSTEPSGPAWINASLHLRIAVLTEDLIEAFLSVCALMVLTRFFADLMFGTLRHLLRRQIARL